VSAPFRYLPVSSELLRDSERRRILDDYAPALKGVEGGPTVAGSIEVPERLVFFLLTGGTEKQVLELHAARAGVAPDEPVVLLAHPGRNSLPAALEVLARLRQDGVEGRIVFLDGPGDGAGLSRLVAAVGGEPGETRPRAERARPFTANRLLDGVRIGLVGEPSDWLVASSPSPGLVREVWGAEVVEVGMAGVHSRIDAADPVIGADFAAAFRDGASDIREPLDTDLAASGAIYAALRGLVEELELDAVTVRCFDLVTGRGATGCLALSRLADDGVVAGCEGDLVSALAMLWVRKRLGLPSWMANPARIDFAANTLRLAHCTVPRCMVSGYALRSHFESGLGAAVQGSLPTGPVTLLRIGGKGLDRVWVAEGEITAQGTEETMCRTQAEVRLRGGAPAATGRPHAPSVADLLEEPLGNHLVLVRGRALTDLVGDPRAPS